MQAHRFSEQIIQEYGPNAFSEILRALSQLKVNSKRGLELVNQYGTQLKKAERDAIMVFLGEQRYLSEGEQKDNERLLAFIDHCTRFMRHGSLKLSENQERFMLELFLNAGITPIEASKDQAASSAAVCYIDQSLLARGKRVDQAMLETLLSRGDVRVFKVKLKGLGHLQADYVTVRPGAAPAGGAAGFPGRSKSRFARVNPTADQQTIADQQTATNEQAGCEQESENSSLTSRSVDKLFGHHKSMYVPYAIACAEQAGLDEDTCDTIYLVLRG